MSRQQRKLEEKMEMLSDSLNRLAHGSAQVAVQRNSKSSIPAEDSDEHRVAVLSRKAATSRDCPGRNPYHTLMTAQSSVYQQWQSRIAYFHWKKQAAKAGACTDMVAFTRLCANEGGVPDGLEGEIPTIYTKQLSQEIIAKHFNFGVLNRPHSVLQLLASRELRAQLQSEFVLIMETDHVFMKPLPNLATETMPAAWMFGYMRANPSQNPIIQRYWPEGDSTKLDPVGPSPLLIHLKQLEQLAQRWMDFSFGLRSNGDAERVMQGWVQEMWGYSIAAASVGIKHRVLREMQTEASSLVGQLPSDFATKSYIFHYTYGIEYSLDGRPQGVNQIGVWSLDKRHYGADHPPRDLEPPPTQANAAAFWLLNAWNEASSGIDTWPQSKSMGTIGWRRVKAKPDEIEGSLAARRVAGTRWSWGEDQRGIEFQRDGIVVTPWGQGQWGLVASISPSSDADTSTEDGIKRCTGCLFCDFANANHNVRIDLTTEPPSFVAIRVGDLNRVDGKLLGLL